MNVSPELLKKCTDGMANIGIQPSDSDISSVCDITGVDRSQAIILLKKWSGWQDAVTHYFDDSTAALKEDTSNRQWESQDNIPFAGEGMSRPPSRTANYVDLSAEHAEATRQHNDQRNEEDELNRAMAESMKDLPGQENGTINAGQQFGPAQREHYNPSQWALAPVASAREVVDHPPAAKRRRTEGSPAFLRSSPGTGYNAALLTIYHSIPLAREALLFPPMEVYSYGHNPDWWAGSTDENSKALGMQESEPGGGDRKKYLAEIQCLMAFLDETNRAYASVDALSELRYCQYYRAAAETTKFLEAWKTAAMDEKKDEPLTQIFTSIASKAPEMDGAPPETKEMFLIDGPVQEAQTQAELLDRIVWNDNANQALDDIWLDQLGHVITMCVHSSDSSTAKVNLSPTEIWYLDRYTPEYRGEMLDIRQQCHALLREQAKLQKAQSRLKEMPPRPASARVNIRKALETARNAIPIAMDDTFRENQKLVDVDTKIDPTHIQRQLDGLLARIDASVDDMTERIKALGATMREIMSDLRDPEHSTHPLRRKYVLQGVSTKPNVTYLRRLNHDLISMHEDEPHEMWQWWRTAWEESPVAQQAGPSAHIENAQETGSPFSVRKVSTKDVLTAVMNEYATAVLVYASEDAMQFRPSPLPHSLRQFIEQDNRALDDETSNHGAQHTGRGRAWSNETNSTVMDDSNPFGDGVYSSHTRDMTPMSTSTIRSFDGPPSPKRPRSSDDSLSNAEVADMPPAYEDVTVPEQQEMRQKTGNKIGYFAEQMMQQVDEHERGR